MIKYFLILLIGFISTSCHLDISRRKIIKDINRNPDVYAELVSKIKESDSIKLNSSLININELPSDIVDVLAKTVLRNRVRYISIDILSCGDKGIEIIIDNKHLEYSPCPDSNFPKPNSYKQTGFIEVWGINKNWFLIKDNDPI